MGSALKRVFSVTKWKVILSQYNMEVRYKPGKENVVADWLSQSFMVNTIAEDREGTSGDVRPFLREWTPEGEGEQGAPDVADQSAEEESSEEQRAVDMEERDEVMIKHIRSS